MSWLGLYELGVTILGVLARTAKPGPTLIDSIGATRNGTAHQAPNINMNSFRILIREPLQYPVLYG